MNKDILLEQFCRHNELPNSYRLIDLKRFGEQINLFNYQQEALKSVMNCLYVYYKEGREGLLRQYGLASGFSDKADKLPIIKDSNGDKDSFALLEKHFSIERDILPFSEICNRAGFWMATGSGKTLVMVKLIEILFELSKLPPEEGGIPKNDIVILAPKPKILEQIKEQIRIFNQKNDLQIELRELKEWEQHKRSKPNLYEERCLTVFYYNSFNVKHIGIDTANETNYANYIHGTDEDGYKYGSWYVLLDEAHKGVTGDSIKQSIYTVLAKNGFLFNFSATFTDAIDKATTVYNFNLEKFINAGYGKHLKVTQQEYSNFNKKNQEEFNDEERKNIVLKSLIVLAVVKKAKKKAADIRGGMYHNPLMLTIANTVNTVDADLKIFFQVLAGIASSRNGNIARAKQELLAELREDKYRYFEFQSGRINDYVMNILNNISFTDIKQLIFNATGTGNIEVIVCESKDELAFQLSTANGKPFALLKASEATKWQDNIVDGYITSREVITKSYFDELNSPDSTINILLGSRIFSEGWDSNRPNVINFINIGVSEAQKFVLQSIGRGVRVEPFKNERNRLEHLPDKEKYFPDLQKYQKLLPVAQAVETLWIFSTNKETVGAILQNIIQSKEKEEWKDVTGIEKTEINIELPIPEYEDIEILNPNPFRINRGELNAVRLYAEETGSKILIAEHNILLKTVRKLNDSDSFIEGVATNQKTDRLFKAIDLHFRAKPKQIKKFRDLIDGDIIHYRNIKTRLEQEEIDLLHQLIEDIIKHKYKSREEIALLFKEGKLTYQQMESEFKIFEQQENALNNFRLPEVDRSFLAEHYYNPVLLEKPSSQELFKNIIKEASELDFYKNLIHYAKNTTPNNLAAYGWWYFSKLVEKIDEIVIPYFDSERGEYTYFFPDFIFWLKKDDKYYLMFIDPKGLKLGQNNARDKLKGFEDIFRKGQTFTFKDKILEVELYYYNKESTNDALIEKYRRYNFEDIF
ncbi:MAG: Type III restriction enzyme, res subunit [bacterium ADurb.Bin157]|nr:MAG: Type III restriction enzyme, res subunit [bacterium ADurb.Bin157]